MSSVLAPKSSSTFSDELLRDRLQGRDVLGEVDSQLRSGVVANRDAQRSAPQTSECVDDLVARETRVPKQRHVLCFLSQLVRLNDVGQIDGHQT